MNKKYPQTTIAHLVGKDERKIIIKIGKKQKTVATLIGPGELIYVYKGV